MNLKADFYFNKAGKWQEAVVELRWIILDCGLSEELKWGVPCYTFQGNNIVLIHDFKEYCAILFFKGALLNDVDGILVQQSENTQATRQIRFNNVLEVVEMKATLKAYIQEAIEVEKAGLKVAFEALTPGRQRGYLLHFSAAKQSKTRESRVEKCIPQILNGKGLDD